MQEFNLEYMLLYLRSFKAPVHNMEQEALLYHTLLQDSVALTKVILCKKKTKKLFFKLKHGLVL